MTEKTISLRATLPLAKPARKQAFGFLSVDVTIRELDAVEENSVLHYARVTVLHRGPNRNIPKIVDIKDFENRYWRRVENDRFYTETAEILQNCSDAGLTKMLDKSIPLMSAEYPNPQPLSAFKADDVQELMSELSKATENLMLFKGEVFRTTPEPTWVVTEAKGHDAGLIVQPFLGNPRHKQNTAFFAADQREQAEEFADTLARELNVTRFPTKGEIAEGDFFGTSFDQTAFANERLVDLYQRVVFSLHGDAPDHILSAAMRLKEQEASPEKIISALMLHQDLKATNSGGPAVNAFLGVAESSALLVASLNEGRELSMGEISLLDEKLSELAIS